MLQANSRGDVNAGQPLSLDRGIVCRVNRSTDQVIPHGPRTLIEFDTVEYDPFGMFDLAFPTKISVPTLFGNIILHVWSYILWAPSAVGVRYMNVIGNGVTGAQDALTTLPTAAQNLYMNHSHMRQIVVTNPGQYFEVQAQQNSGGDLSLFSLSNVTIVFGADIVYSGG